ncbi:hypothetical protein QFC19_003993 [Naganishia cerealis]|uniref:Uncharacterized protein n=1 Tax=Naganishia cerealis TaxID=610337 RepID=A0ACC2W0E5_9TREE|nr:hypothetical protein QFC19_003993 [Naganishia cerealis]
MLRNAYENSTTAAARVLAERLVPTGSPLHKATVDRVLGPSKAYGRPASIVAPQTVRAMGRGLMMGRIPLPVTSSNRRQSSSSASGPAGNISKTVQLAPVVGCGKRVPGVVIDSSVTARQEDAAVKGILVKKGKKALRGLKKVVTISDEDRVKWFTRCELELCDVAVTSSLVERLDISEEEEDHSCLVDEVCPFSMDEVCDWPEVAEGSKPVEVAEGSKKAEVAEESKPVEEAQGSKPVEEAQGSKPVEEQEEMVLEEDWIMDEVCPFRMDEECGWPEEAQGSEADG